MRPFKCSKSDMNPNAFALLNNPRLNKGTGFTMAERDQYGLHGLLPPRVSTLEQQVEWSLDNLRQLVDTSEEAPDYIVTGALRAVSAPAAAAASKPSAKGKKASEATTDPLARLSGRPAACAASCALWAAVRELSTRDIVARAIYTEAIERRYRFLSFGDAMLLDRHA